MNRIGFAVILLWPVVLTVVWANGEQEQGLRNRDLERLYIVGEPESEAIETNIDEFHINRDYYELEAQYEIRGVVQFFWLYDRDRENYGYLGSYSPLQGAQVILYDLNYQEIGRDTTNADGGFVIGPIRARGPVRLVAGYPHRVEPGDVPRGSETTFFVPHIHQIGTDVSFEARNRWDDPRTPYRDWVTVTLVTAFHHRSLEIGGLEELSRELSRFPGASILLPE